MVARTINETLMEVEHTPPVHKRVRSDRRQPTFSPTLQPRAWGSHASLQQLPTLLGARALDHTHTQLHPACGGCSGWAALAGILGGKPQRRRAQVRCPAPSGYLRLQLRC